jgi:hypothetical protein
MRTVAQKHQANHHPCHPCHSNTRPHVHTKRSYLLGRRSKTSPLASTRRAAVHECIRARPAIATPCPLGGTSNWCWWCWCWCWWCCHWTTESFHNRARAMLVGAVGGKGKGTNTKKGSAPVLPATLVSRHPCFPPHLFPATLVSRHPFSPDFPFHPQLTFGARQQRFVTRRRGRLVGNDGGFSQPVHHVIGVQVKHGSVFPTQHAPQHTRGMDRAFFLSWARKKRVNTQCAKTQK